MKPRPQEAGAVGNRTGFTVECKIHLKGGRRGRKKLRKGEAPPAPKPVPPGNIPRISRLMALAIRFDHLIRTGQVEDYADLARLGNVSRARITQIMNLLNLAPDIQENLLFLPNTIRGRDLQTERELRMAVSEFNWYNQRQIFDIIRFR
jgi:hypothetical protein